RGNARELREYADMLDQWSNAMRAAYLRVAGDEAADTINQWLTDGQDHWLTATEAQGSGLITKVLDSASATAGYGHTLAHISHFPAAAAALLSRNNGVSDMPQPTNPGSRAPERPDNIDVTAAAAEAARKAVADARKKESERVQSIRAAFAP